MERIVSENEGGGSQMNQTVPQPQLWPQEGLGFSGRASTIYSSDEPFLQSASHNNIGSSHPSYQLPYNSTDVFEVFNNYCRSLNDLAPCLDAAKTSPLSEAILPKPPSIQATSAANQTPALINQGNNYSASCKKQTSSKRSRKMQEKRIIYVPLSKGLTGRHNGSEGHSSDIYAWRKYGQKPIKGSPYPRGYYRCSSCKGCSARKQVEICKNDPSMVTITYTSDHNHPDHFSTTHPAQALQITTSSEGKLTSKPGEEEEAEATLSETFQALDSCSIASSSTSGMLMDPLAVDAAMAKRASHFDMKSGDSIPISSYLSTSQELEEFFAELEELPESSANFGSTATIKSEPLEDEPGKYENFMTILADPCSNHVVWSSSSSSTPHRMVNT